MINRFLHILVKVSFIVKKKVEMNVISNINKREKVRQ